MKTYGIYICYPPTVDMRNEGLGRYLAAFIKGAENNPGIAFKIICPSWSKNGLYALFESEGVSLNQVDILSPEGEPVILKVHQVISNYKKKRDKSKGDILKKIIVFADNKIKNRLAIMSKRLASSYKFSSLAPALLEGLVIALVAIILAPFMLMFLAFYFFQIKLRRSRLLTLAKSAKRRIMKLIENPKDEGFVVNLYNSMVQAESERMLTIIDDMKDIHAWYSPTAFWESFTQINAPKLMCVPDVVLTRFPGGFSQIGGERFYNTFKTIQKTINRNKYFVTYSDDVKNKTLVEHYNVEKENVFVVKHAPNKLNHWLEVTGFPDVRASTKFYAEKLLLVALSRQRDAYVQGLSTNFKFLFYASQLRPNKNVVTLLKAYNYLLKKKFIHHKLILTGTRDVLKNVSDYITENNLEKDVLFLSSLSVQELAACYKLADLAVNPTLSEGGCPFTFTEALSVGTPVVMGRIGVTEEVLTDPKLQEMTFFDPYDWKSIADKIEWALDNLDPLREVQLQTYHQLMKRTWEDVVSEHITAMDEIADKFHADRGNSLEQ